MAFRCDKNNTRMRKTARKTTSNAVSQTTIDEFFHKDNADGDDTKSKRLKDDKLVTTQHGISSLLQSFMRQCVNGIGTRLMDTLPRQQWAQTNGFHYRRTHITLQKPSRNDSRMIRARSIPMHLQRHPEPETMTSQRRSTKSTRQ